jgi:hypothetical protein
LNRGGPKTHDGEDVGEDEEDDFGQPRVASAESSIDKTVEAGIVLFTDEACFDKVASYDGDARAEDVLGEDKQRNGEEEAGVGAEVAHEGDLNVGDGATLQCSEDEKWDKGDDRGEDGAKLDARGISPDQSDPLLQVEERATFHQE